MTSEAQIEVNRENGKLGGVKTDEGKAKSKYNAIKHGLLCQNLVMKNEDENCLIELGKKMRAELKPETEFELLIVDRIVANIWRLKRALRGETEMIEAKMKPDDLFPEMKKINFGEVLEEDLKKHDSMSKFIRYETSIEKGIYKALHELQRLQAQRKGENPPLPIAVDVDISKE